MSSVTVLAKKFYTSKTIIVNALVILAGILTQVSDVQLSFTHAQWYVTVVAAVNIALRFLTKLPVAGSVKPVDVKEPEQDVEL